MKKIFLILAFLMLLPFNDIFSQQRKGLIIVPAQIIDGDTVPFYILPPINIISKWNFTSAKEKRRYSRYVRYIKKVYPYAKLAGQRLAYYDSVLTTVDSEKEKKRVMKMAEESIKSEFEKDLRKLSFSQGKMLLKLIDRECNRTSYQLVKELRGGTSAFFWQSFARIFKYNLKVHYDPKGKDKMLEHIVKRLEAGYYS